MRHVLTLLVLVALAGAEAALWVENPLHVPDGFLTARAFGVQMFKTGGPAMEPTLPAKANVLVSSWAYWKGSPKVGDIIAFVYPPDPQIADVKRIVAAGGSTVVIRGGDVYVDGRKTAEPYVQDSVGSSRLVMNAVHVPADSFFVMGDNRDVSEDSRNYGVIPRSSIIGRRWL